MTLRAVLRGLTPPLVMRAASRIVGGAIQYVGPYSSWLVAERDALGYAHGEIVDRVTASTRAVLDGEATYEQDGISFHVAPPPPSIALTGLLYAAATDGGRLSVLDFGGSLGSHLLRWRRWLTLLPAVTWSVVEQPSFVDAGRRLYDGQGLAISFQTGVSDVKDQPNAVLASGVLQYLPNALDTLESLAAMNSRVLVIDRSPFARDGVAKVLVQKVSKKLYPASYPLRTLSRADVAAVLSNRYELLQEFSAADSPILLRGAEADYAGSIWRRRGS